MIKTKKIGLTFLFSLLLTIVLFNFTGTSAEAASTDSPVFHFVFDSTTKDNGSEYELKRDNVSLSVEAAGWTSPFTVDWSTSEDGVVDLEKSSTDPLDPSRRLRRIGPGFSSIKADIISNGRKYTIRCSVKVNLEFDIQQTGMVLADFNSARILVINEINDINHVNDQKQVYLKYMDDPSGSAVPVSGGAISASAVLWESDNEGVATISATGMVKAVGSGNATITATSNTMSSQDKPMKISMKVVVKPTFSLDFSTPSNPKNSSDNKNTPSIVTGVPSNFVIASNAKYAVNLQWEVYDSSTNSKLPAGSSSKMTYSVSEISGAVEFTKVKAGTYEIYAFVDKSYDESNTTVPYAYMKIIVPIDVGPKSIVMTVGDTYSILENSNIPVAGVFSYVSEHDNIAFPNNNSVITAMGKGTTKVTLTYVPAFKLYESPAAIIIELNVTVIDGISLSASNATLFTKGTLLLKAIVTDPTETITWSSSVPSVASVEGGLVTGLKDGITIITAKQTINGVLKVASCEIRVQPSVATIVVDPEEISLPIGGYTTLHATITPKINNVTLKWRSSDESIVKVVESSALTATIQGVAGGHAVISAINQDNVVVGYCHVSVQQSATSVVLSETDVTVDLKTKRLQIRATVYPENALNKAIVWSSTDETKAKVDENGLVTILKPGTVSIIATSDDNAKAKAICNINIQIPIVSIALDETTKIMYVGQSARLSYVILPNNASTNTVTWTSTNPSVATVDATGKVSAKSVGSTVIILKALDGGHSIYCTITVKQVATGIKFDVTELNLKTGESYYLKPTLTPKGSTDNDIVWESSDTKIAIVDDNGKVIAKDAGTAIIMARTEVGGVAYCKVTVTEPVNGLILNFSEKTIFIGDEFKLKVSVSPSEASELGVTWKSSNPKVATISKTGEITGLVGGVTVITCTTLDGGYSATCVITVRESVTTIKLDYETYRLGIRKTGTLKATVTTETATNLKVFWSTSNDRIATVNQKGKVTGIALGYATITATAMDGSEVEASCEVRIVTPVDSITMDKAYMAMLVGDSKELNATIRPSNSTYRSAKWTSTDDSVAIVDDDGVVTALKAGSATIMAEAKDNTGKKAICYVAVRDRLPSTGITLMDKKLVMVPGEEKVVEVRLNPAESTDSTTWSTDNAAIARVDKKTGKISARSTGTANITVMTDSGKTANIEVIVIGLNMTELVLEQYTTYPYPLQVEGATTAVSWSIDNPQVAVVTNGSVSTRAVGTATITATVNGRKLKCRLKVIKID